MQVGMAVASVAEFPKICKVYHIINKHRTKVSTIPNVVKCYGFEILTSSSTHTSKSSIQLSLLLTSISFPISIRGL